MCIIISLLCCVFQYEGCYGSNRRTLYFLGGQHLAAYRREREHQKKKKKFRNKQTKHTNINTHLFVLPKKSRLYV